MPKKPNRPRAESSIKNTVDAIEQIFIENNLTDAEIQAVLKNFRDEVYISIQTFAERMEMGDATARTISRQRDLCEKGISVNANGGKKGGTRIHWQRYLKHIGA